MIQGIDISRHQGDVDFNKVVVEGKMQFCFCKLTEGGDYQDPKVSAYWAQMLDQGSLLRGLYHFARPDLRPGRSGGETEGRNFARAAKSLGHYSSGCLPPMLDFEKYSDSDDKDNIPWIQGWLDVVESELGRDAGIYTGANIWKYEVGNTDDFSSRTLWQVDYTQTRQEPKPIADGKWDWSFWQWSGGGDFAYYGPVPGVNGDCDVNRFNGSESQLDELALFGKARPEPTFEGGIMPLVDIRSANEDLVKRVQGLLMSHGIGPDGLAGKDGLPDGIAGPITVESLAAFNRAIGHVDEASLLHPSTWYGLLLD